MTVRNNALIRELEEQRSLMATRAAQHAAALAEAAAERDVLAARVAALEAELAKFDPPAGDNAD